MKLLICTQVLDKNHPILGFFHRWVEEFAKHYEEVHVICLQKGEYTLPAHVLVHSLGKEEGENKFKYLFRFYTLIWKLRHNYEHVFVHMNQIYVILGALLWRLWGKRVGLWYAHGAVSASLKLAEKLTHLIFTSTKEGLRLNTPKRRIVGQGIDVERFSNKERSQSDVLKLITVGRITQSKNVDTLLRACGLLKAKEIPFTFTIVGVALTEEEQKYETQMKALASSLGIEREVIWYGAVANHALPDVLQTSDIFIHDGSTNSLDKALVEASLCGCVVISSNPAYAAVTGPIAPEYIYTVKDALELSRLIELARQNDKTLVRSVEAYFRQHYSVSNLISVIVERLNT